ncbi:uncharacterized protein UV8b_00917 [Ustilaginoidea virens]|uniref:Zn(2)-C6 fungal-type domain-containing protein n=1 Tax=Ustilaginoidea virens TaxID=1159556 RepID=A0A8E5HJM8_USTVR|nr:uncharacterized protein UV8b_00917 [Ustilaginoidea virens]QUC16676.1 hypothetical protein UV8b_00917 [Ustilaginoidea virens]
MGSSQPREAAPLDRPGHHHKQRVRQLGSSGKASGTAGPVRRRISRACDQCNQLRTKCDGKHPCAHCVEYGLGCEYMREKKKRGKASRKDLAERAAAQAAAAASSLSGDISDGKESSNSPATEDRTDGLMGNARSESMSSNGLGAVHDSSLGGTASMDPSEFASVQSATTPSQFSDLADHAHMQQQHSLHMTPDGISDGRPMGMGAYGNLSTSYDRQSLNSDDLLGGSNPGYGHAAHQGSVHGYPDMSFGILDGQSPSDFNHGGGGGGVGFRLANAPLGGYQMAASASSNSAWGGVAVPAQPQHGQFQTPVQQRPNYGQNALRYPVLQPLLPYLSSIVPIPLACDLIDFYFASSSSPADLHPTSPYILASVFRRRAFLHPTRPRKCQPALLASMLWVAAQTSEAPLLTSVPSARGQICQKLLELTIGLLKPLLHSSPETACANPDQDVTAAAAAAALGGLGSALPGPLSIDTALAGESDVLGASCQLDDLVTYIHLATVVSASEYKGASLRWWNVTWSLARELRLGRELAPSEPRPSFDPSETEADGMDGHDILRNSPGYVTEETREERRRVWWLLYVVDRHLALCYNRPLSLLDVECARLRQPLDDAAWQSGCFGFGFDFVHGHGHGHGQGIGPHSLSLSLSRSRPAGSGMLGIVSKNQEAAKGPGFGPQFECRDDCIFGYFLPLMTILGEIVDLHHARNHPRFGSAFRASGECGRRASRIRQHLESYEESLKRLELRKAAQAAQAAEGADGGTEDTAVLEVGGLHADAAQRGAVEATSSPSAHSVHTASSRITETEARARAVSAYGTHVMHVLHILLEGKWDPLNLLDDQDLWISSPEFVTASGHAVAAAEAVGQILEYDAGLELMPFFFGAYLLHGSFLLLLMADKLQAEASPNVVRACETIVRAHEACVVTLSTEYQRKFSKVMRGALALVRGRVPEDMGEQLQRRRELLGLYRWTGDGTGLAL